MTSWQHELANHLGALSSFSNRPGRQMSLLTTIIFRQLLRQHGRSL